MKDFNKIKNNSKKNVQNLIFDLSAAITENTVVYPGDPSFYKNKVVLMEEGSHFDLYQIHLGNHTGTHIDFPAHVIRDGMNSSDYELKDLMNSGFIIEVPESEKTITKKFIKSQNINLKNEIVFFKTANSKLSKQEKFNKEYVYIEPDAAKELVAREVKIVGIDYISVDSYESEELAVHHEFLSKGILIVEGLELSRTPAGKFYISIIPLNIPAMDGLPVRVIAQK